MIKDTEFYIDHETRIRIQEQNALEIKKALIHLENKIESRFSHMENKIHTNFIFVIGLIITSMIVPIILHALKLI